MIGLPHPEQQTAREHPRRGLINGAASLETSRPPLSPPSSPSRRVRRPAPMTAVAHHTPVGTSPVQPALHPPTEALTLQHPHSYQPAQIPASAGAREGAAQPPGFARSATEAATAPASSQADVATEVQDSDQRRNGGFVSEMASEEQTLPTSCQQPAASEAYRIGRLWADERFVACRLLALVALAKRLMLLPATGQQGDAQAGRMRS